MPTPNADPIPRQLSLYVHVPYCFSPCFYCGCTCIITRDLSRGRPYLERVIREVEQVSSLFDRDREVVQLHFGGGTPNFLRPEELGELIESIGRHFHFAAPAIRDFSIEIDPRNMHDGDIAAYAALGLNRASLGVQDFDPQVQQAVNRIQSVEQTLRADLIQELMCQGRIDIRRIERRHDIDFRQYFADSLQRLEPLVDDGLATADENGIAATSRGRLLLRIIAMCFDRYLQRSQAQVPRPRYSRVI